MLALPPLSNQLLQVMGKGVQLEFCHYFFQESGSIGFVILVDFQLPLLELSLFFTINRCHIVVRWLL